VSPAAYWGRPQRFEAENSAPPGVTIATSSHFDVCSRTVYDCLGHQCKEGDVKAVISAKRGEVELLEVPLRDMGPEEVQVKIAYCGIGGADPFIISGEIALPLPWHMGYQASGVITAMDKAAKARGLKVGDRVALDQLRYCGACYNCMHGHETFCENREFPHGYLDSMMAEYATLHQRQVWKIPDSISLEEASLTEVVGASMPAIDLAPFQFGESVFISGMGSCGLLILQMAKLRGGTRLTISEPVEAKRKLALKLGADHAIDPRNQDVVAEAMRITDNAASIASSRPPVTPGRSSRASTLWPIAAGLYYSRSIRRTGSSPWTSTSSISKRPGYRPSSDNRTCSRGRSICCLSST
jgi:threonine dehydrogenase-like Zn-dependent dehydrogenase